MNSLSLACCLLFAPEPAERHIDVSARTVLHWIQTFGPQLAKAIHSYRRRLGRRWYVDEVFCFRGKQKRYLYRAILRSVPSKWWQHQG